LHGSLRCDTRLPRLRASENQARGGGSTGAGTTADIGDPPWLQGDDVEPDAAGERSGGQVPSLISDYLPLVIFVLIGGLICSALLVAPFLVAYRNPDSEKLSAYECGFNPFDDARMKFDVRFYLVSLLFIIFDLEVAFLFPWTAAFRDIGHFGFWSMIIFLGVLTVGFVYEWKKGALEWD
jgi:NADH-quinone oxidoreductase subunit A